MGLKQMLHLMDSREIAQQMAYDLIEADDARMRQGQPATPPRPARPPLRTLTQAEMAAELARLWPPAKA